MLRKILALSSLVLCFTVSAQNYNVPSYCEQGRAHNDLKIEGPKYLLEEMSYRFKGDYHFDFSFESRYVDFYNSASGYSGSDSTNSEMNAYLDISIPRYSRGPIYLWAIEDDGDPFNSLNNGCSYMEAFVQDAPTISKKSLSGGKSIVASVNASYDVFYSKIANEDNAKAVITFIAQHQDYSHITERRSGTSKGVTMYPQYSGFYNVSAEIFDGTYKKTIQLGVVTYSGGGHCTSCGQIPY